MEDIDLEYGIRIEFDGNLNELLKNNSNFCLNTEYNYEASDEIKFYDGCYEYMGNRIVPEQCIYCRNGRHVFYICASKLNISELNFNYTNASYSHIHNYCCC